MSPGPWKEIMMHPDAADTLTYWRQRRLETARDLRQVRRHYRSVFDPGDLSPEGEARLREALQLAQRDVIRRAGDWARYRPTRRGAVMMARDCKPSRDAMNHCPQICGADDAYIEGLHEAWEYHYHLREIAEGLK